MDLYKAKKDLVETGSELFKKKAYGKDLEKYK